MWAESAGCTEWMEVRQRAYKGLISRGRVVGQVRERRGGVGGGKGLVLQQVKCISLISSLNHSPSALGLEVLTKQGLPLSPSKLHQDCNLITKVCPRTQCSKETFCF